jgi:hypothetical protein
VQVYHEGRNECRPGLCIRQCDVTGRSHLASLFQPPHSLVGELSLFTSPIPFSFIYIWRRTKQLPLVGFKLRTSPLGTRLSGFWRLLAVFQPLIHWRSQHHPLQHHTCGGTLRSGQGIAEAQSLQPPHPVHASSSALSCKTLASEERPIWSFASFSASFGQPYL